MKSNGNGTFGPAVHYAAPPTPDSGSDGLGGGDILNPEDVSVVALKPGGPLDVIESLYDHSIDVFLGNGDGTFQPAVGYTTGEYPRDVQVADLTGNGIPDLIVDNVGVGPGGAASFAEGFEDGSLAVLMGNGDGTFQAPIQYNAVYYPGYAAVGDFNNDGAPDLAVTGVNNSSTINILLTEPTADPVTVVSPASATGVLPDQPASVFANSSTGMTTVLSVLGADSTTAETNLTYTWSVLSRPSGAANPTFSSNGSNAAQNTTATFSGFGLYTFEVTITDPLGHSITSSVQVYAVQNTPPTIGSASLVVAPSPVSGTSTTLEIPLGSSINGVESDNGYVNLTYTWATVGTPPAGVTFTQVGLPQTETGIVYATGNSFSCDYETTATFTKAGNYVFQVTITDPQGDNITSSHVTVTVNQTLTSITVTPSSVNVTDGGTQQFSASARDQFGNPMATQPTFTWTSTGLGSVNSSGLYTAPSSGTGSATVQAKSGSVRSASAVHIIGANNLTHDEQFVQGLYNDFLGRPGAVAELDGWVALLPQLGRTGVANAVARSNEALVRVVNSLYSRLLNRSADAAGLAGWVGAIRQYGMTEEQVASGILASPEFASRANALIGGTNTNANFVQALYLLLLERTPTTTEVQGWLPGVAPLGRQTVAGLFLGSSEFRSDAVRTFYGDPSFNPLPWEPFFVNLLHRSQAPAATEISGWVNLPYDFLTVEVIVAGSQEYYNLH